MRKGEIWRVRLPVPDGREQGGTRPAVIIQDDAYIDVLPLVLVVPLTSEMSATHFAGTRIVQPDEANGLTSPSVAMVFQTRALDRRRFVSRWGTLEAGVVEDFLQLLRELTGMR